MFLVFAPSRRGSVDCALLEGGKSAAGDKSAGYRVLDLVISSCSDSMPYRDGHSITASTRYEEGFHEGKSCRYSQIALNEKTNGQLNVRFRLRKYRRAEDLMSWHQLLHESDWKREAEKTFIISSTQSEDV